MPTAPAVIRKQLKEAVLIAGPQAKALEVTPEFVRTILARGDTIRLEDLGLILTWDGQLWRVCED